VNPLQRPSCADILQDSDLIQLTKEFQIGIPLASNKNPNQLLIKNSLVRTLKYQKKEEPYRPEKKKTIDIYSTNVNMSNCHSNMSDTKRNESIRTNGSVLSYNRVNDLSDRRKLFNYATKYSVQRTRRPIKDFLSSQSIRSKISNYSIVSNDKNGILNNEIIKVTNDFQPKMMNKISNNFFPNSMINSDKKRNTRNNHMLNLYNEISANPSLNHKQSSIHKKSKNFFTNLIL